MSKDLCFGMVPGILRNANKQQANERILKSSAGAPLALVEDDTLLPPERPISGPEIDDLNPKSRPYEGSESDDMDPSQSNPADYPGVDDALIPRRGVNGSREPGVDDALIPRKGVSGPREPGNDDALIPRRGDNNRPRKAFPVPEEPSFSEEPIPGKGLSLPDVNVYQQKKTFAQGMMDLALLTANANQLRYVLDAGSIHTYYHVTLTFILTSITLQVGVGILLLWNSRFNINKEHHIFQANRINNFTVIGIFLITILNVFITAFGLPDRSLIMATQVLKEEEVESIENGL